MAKRKKRTRKKVAPRKDDKKKKKKRRFLFFLLIFGAAAAFLIASLLYSNLSLKEEDYYDSDCSSISRLFSIEDACSLNLDEAKVLLKRDQGDFYVEKLIFEFLPSDSAWKVDGGQCNDVRLEGRDYGGYCEIVGEGESQEYVFDTSLGKQNSVRVIVEGGGMRCVIGERDIRGSC